MNGYPVPFAPCTPSNNCFAVGHGTTFTVPPAFLHGALNTLAIVVYNQGAWTGLAVNATLSSDCSGSENGVANQCATLKVCKVAGPGVASGTPFTFGYTDNFGSGTGSIPAGPDRRILQTDDQRSRWNEGSHRRDPTAGRHCIEHCRGAACQSDRFEPGHWYSRRASYRRDGGDLYRRESKGRIGLSGDMQAVHRQLDDCAPVLCHLQSHSGKCWTDRCSGGRLLASL